MECQRSGGAVGVLERRAPLAVDRPTAVYGEGRA